MVVIDEGWKEISYSHQLQYVLFDRWKNFDPKKIGGEKWCGWFKVEKDRELYEDLKESLM